MSGAAATNGYFGSTVNGVKSRHDNPVVLNNTEINYVRDVDGNVLAEYDISGNLVAEYIYANGQRIARIDSSGEVALYLNDHLGSARAMIGNGWSANYYPYGEIASQSGSTEDTHFDFTGHERDAGTGLIYAGARFLSLSSGGG